MILKAYRDARFQYVKARDFAVFKADSKYVIGITPDGREWLLAEGMTLKVIEAVLTDVIRVNRSVLVKGSCVTGCWRTRVDGKTVVTVLTPVAEYTLARRTDPKPFHELVEQNNKRALRTRRPPTESPE